MVDVILLEELRQQRGFTQEQLSFKLGYKSPSTYGMKVRGQRVFMIRDLVLLANIFGVSTDYLLQR